MATKYSNNHDVINVEEHKKFMGDFISKYGVENKRVEFKTSNLTYRTPFLADLLNSKTFLSVHYLAKAYEGYKHLKLKHDTHRKSLEDLLGI